MQEFVITLSTPVFFLLMAIEFIVGRWRGKDTYRRDDAINSISLGILSQVSGAFMKLLLFGIYAICLKYFSVFKLPSDQWWVWVFALLGYDFCYYWLHRLSHEVAVLWAAHVVHHQSEHYNLSTALRQTSSGALLGWMFYLPLAILGVPLQVFIVVALIDLLYQFWVHTEQIDKLGWFDRVFVSPSNHRVHHAVNDNYLDKNYGGILILWDRMFGTFKEETSEAPVFGTRSPLRSWDPIWANLEVYVALLNDAWHASNWLDKFRVWFKPPGWRPADLSVKFPKAEFDLHRQPFRPQYPALWGAYALAQFALLLGITTHFLAVHPKLGIDVKFAYAAWILCDLWCLGALLQMRKYALQCELTRLGLTALGLAWAQAWFGTETLPMAVIATAIATQILSGIWVTIGARKNTIEQTLPV